MKNKLIAVSVLILVYIVIAILGIHEEITAPIMCIAIAATLFWPVKRN